MQKKLLGRTGLKVSCIGFGSIPIVDYPEKHSIRLVQKAIDAGINYFDTARGYGDTEAKIGKAIKGQRDSVIIATKTHLRPYKEAKESIEESLKQLQVDIIDIFLLHCVDDKETLAVVLGGEGAYRAVQEAQKAGKVRYVGISSHENSVIIEAIKREHFDMILAKFSVTDQSAKDVLFPLVQKLGIGIAIMKSLDGGLLAIPREAAQLDIQGESMGVAQAAVRFSLASDLGATVIVGLGTEKELEEIAPLGNKRQFLNDEYVEQITKLAEKLGKGFCLQCGYCKSHCPEGIDIPFVFRARIYKEKFGLQHCTMWTPESIRTIVDKCTVCGKCTPHCPNKLEIPELLKKCVRILEK